ncbi:MAG: beta-ketoacyl-[acyl-carrier-protein] synthase family protein [Desulfarculaceae bacterium]|nr:beta-ketoacyl-[acyl-carrier-protein] synthase family protein [Desulfarculaceae bacterium]
MPEPLNHTEPVVITGMGIISALGRSAVECLEGLSKEGTPPAAPDIPGCTVTKPSFGAELPSGRDTEKGRTLALAGHAFEQAVNQAGLEVSAGERTGICAGTTVASQLNDIEFYSRYRKGTVESYDAVHRYLAGNPAEALKRDYGLGGPAMTVVNACSSGTDAVGTAMAWLNSGRCDAVIAGGADELNRVPLSGFNALGILSDSPCRPFDADRDGLNLGEGAAFLVLETLSSAKARGAAPMAECRAWATASDAYHLTSPRPDGLGLETAVTKALNRAGISGKRIGFINAHGTGTQTNDRTEGLVFGKLFKSSVKIYSTKGHTGHTLGAAGAIEAVLTVLSLQRQWLPASRGYADFDENVGIRPVEKEQAIHAEYAMSTSLAFGGMNSVLIFKRYNSEGDR